MESAAFGTPEINVGVWPMMISAILARNLPRKVVLEMMLLGDRWSAGRMQQAGLVSKVLPDLAALDAATAEVAGALAKKSPAIVRLGGLKPGNGIFQEAGAAFDLGKVRRVTHFPGPVQNMVRSLYHVKRFLRMLLQEETPFLAVA